MVDLLVTVVTRMVLVATTPLAAQMATALAVAAGYWSGFAVNYLGQRNFALKLRQSPVFAHHVFRFGGL